MRNKADQRTYISVPIQSIYIQVIAMLSHVKYAITCAAAVLSVAQAIGDPSARPRPWQARHGLTQAKFQTTFNDLVDKGYRLQQVSPYSVNGEMFYAGKWEHGIAGDWVAFADLTEDQYNKTFSPFEEKGWGPQDLRVYNGPNGEVKFSAIWDPSTNVFTDTSLSPAELKVLINYQYGPLRDFANIASISGFEVDGESRFAAVWGKGTNGRKHVKLDLTSEEFIVQNLNYTKVHLCKSSLENIDVYTVGGEHFFAGIWEEGLRAEHQFVRIDMTGAEYQAEFTKQKNRNYLLHSVVGYEVDGSARYAAIWEEFCRTKTGRECW